jgi:hypothetical protein
MNGKLGVYFIFIKVTKYQKFTRVMNQTTVVSLFPFYITSPTTQ